MEEGEIPMKIIVPYFEAIVASWIFSLCKTRRDLVPVFPVLWRNIVSKVLENAIIHQEVQKTAEMITVNLNMKGFSETSCLSETFLPYSVIGARTWEFSNGREGVIITTMKYEMKIHISSHVQREILRSSGFHMLNHPSKKDYKDINKLSSVVSFNHPELDTQSLEHLISTRLGRKNVRAAVRIEHHNELPMKLLQTIRSVTPTAPSMSSGYQEDFTDDDEFSDT